MVKNRLFELQQFEVPLIGIKVRTHRLREYGVRMANFDKFPFNIHCNVIYFNRNQSASIHRIMKQLYLNQFMLLVNV